MYEALYQETKNRINTKGRENPYSALIGDIRLFGKDSEKLNLIDLITEEFVNNKLDCYRDLSVDLYLILIKAGLVKYVNDFRMRLWVNLNRHN